MNEQLCFINLKKTAIFNTIQLSGTAQGIKIVQNEMAEPLSESF